MKIYSIDWGWAGSATCVAESVEEAAEIFRVERETRLNAYNNQIDIKSIMEHEIVKGLVHYNIGDQ